MNCHLEKTSVRIAVCVYLITAVVHFVGGNSRNIGDKLSNGNNQTSVLAAFRIRETQQATKTVPFCLLVKKADVYSNRIIRTTAILVGGYEQSFLYSPQCDGQDNLVWAENGPFAVARTEIGNDARLQSILRTGSSGSGAGRANVTIIGSFIGPGGKRFGQLDQFRSKFIVKKIEKASPVSRATRWPRSTGRDDAYKEEQSIRFLNNEFVFYLAGAPNHSVPSLSDDFTFTDPNGRVIDKKAFMEVTFPPFRGIINDIEIEVYLQGDKGTVTGSLIKSSDDAGEKRYRYINKYNRQIGAWKIISSQLKNAVAPQNAPAHVTCP